MHDESPGGQACADRALAFWTDPNNFGNAGNSKQGSKRQRNSAPRRSAYREPEHARKVAVAGIIGFVTSILIGQFSG